MERYQRSTEWLHKTESVIPTASQTFSKSHYSLPKGAAPLFLEEGSGAYVTDIDGNRYIDLVNGLLCVSLGYQHPTVDNAIKKQLQSGISFSLPHKLEMALAERLVEHIPCSEQVRFGKNGTDVTSAAVRLARAVTGKDHVLVCGYHGWQDWYIGSTTRHMGVPQTVRERTHSFPFNDLAALTELVDHHENQVAAIIMEQMNVEQPAEGYLQAVRELCDEKGIILVFDEIITGFRFDIGGAQSVFGVTPDLATFGKGMANGMPISAIVGRRELMQEMDTIFFSGTFGGETLSLAAACATIDFMVEHDVPGHMKLVGGMLAEAVSKTAKVYECDDWFSLVGHPSWKIWKIDNDPEFIKKTLLLQLLAEQGVLSIGSHNISWSLKPENVETIVSAYQYAFETIQGTANPGTLIQGEIIKPVFQVRK